MWKESFAIGIDRIDTQHKDLFQMLGITQRSLQKTVRAADYKHYCMNTLYFLKNYRKQHFVDEESYMDSIGYADIEAHKKIHEALSKTLDEFENRVIESDYDATVIRESLDKIIAAFIQHVVSEDQKIPKGNTSLHKLASNKTKANKPYTEMIADDIAVKTDQVLKLMAGFGSIRATTGIKSTFESDICFRVNLVGEAKKAMGFIYSKGIALEVFKSMTGKEMIGVDEIIQSALAEISCIIAGKISDAFVANGIPCDIEAPISVPWNSFPEDAEHIMMATKTGDMVVLVFDR